MYSIKREKKSGPWAVSYKAGPVTCAWLANQIRGFRNPARLDAGEKNKFWYCSHHSSVNYSFAVILISVHIFVWLVAVGKASFEDKLINAIPLVHFIQWFLFQFSFEKNDYKVPINMRLFLACYLKNRKHAPCFYWVIETRVEVWENEKCCGNTGHRQVFPQLSRVLPNFHQCFYNSIETQSTCYLFFVENTAARKRKTTCLFWLSKCKFSLLAPSLRQQLVQVLCLHRVIETQFPTNQHAYFHKTIFKLTLTPVITIWRRISV